jgi:ABC-2 type transport system permease protein
MVAIFKRELKAYFQTPLGYIFMSLFLLIAGILFVLGNVFEQNPSFAGFLSSIIFIFLLAVPVLTMRLLSDDMRTKTDQLLITSPIRVTEIVLGKYLAAMVVFFMTIALTALYAMVLSFHGDIDGWETLGSYIGFILLGGSFIAIGLFVSATTENQVVAAIVTFCALLISWIMDFITQGVPTDPFLGFIFLAVAVLAICAWIYIATKNLLIPIVIGVAGVGASLIVFLLNPAVYVGFIGKTLEWLSLVRRYNPFPRGILSFDSVVYYVTVSALFLFLTVRLIEKKRWS